MTGAATLPGMPPYSNPYASGSYVFPPPTRAPGTVPPVFGEVPRAQGPDWLQALPYVVGGAGALLPVLGSGFGSRQPTQYGPLPGSSQIAGNLTDVDRLIQGLQGARISGDLTSQLRDLTSQELATRGIEGPLASSVIAGGQARLLSDFEQQKIAQLASLLGLRGQLAGQATSLEERARDAAAQRLAAQRQDRQRMFQLFGTGLGALGGTFLLPGLGTAGGAGVGGAAGAGLEDLLYNLGTFGDRY